MRNAFRCGLIALSLALPAAAGDSPGEVAPPERLARVEADVASLTSQVHGLGKSLDTVLSEIRELSRRDRTDWAALGAWGAVLVALAGYMHHLTMEPIRREIEELSDLRARCTQAQDRSTLALVLHLLNAMERQQRRRAHE